MIDIAIILFVVIGIYVGAKRGVMTELLSTLGFIISLILAFIFKNPISLFLYDKLPFFTFGGIIKGVTALNILLYEVIAFLIALFICLIIFKILKFATRIFEGFLDSTIIFGIPSKILGGIIGGIKWIFIACIIIFIIKLPVFGNKYEIKSGIYDASISLFSNMNKEVDNVDNMLKEFRGIYDEYENNPDKNQFNLDTLDLMLKYKIIDINSAEKLYSKGKFRAISDIDTVLDKYR